MEQNEFDTLLRKIDRLVDTTKSRQREYYRGYREGIKLYHMARRTIVHFCLDKYYKATGDPYLDAYSHGFIDGCKGMNMEERFKLLQTFKASYFSDFKMPKFVIFFKDKKKDKEVVVGVLEERRKFERGDNITGLLKLAKKIFAIKTEDLSGIYALKISG
jgi:hypothetical protein